MKLTWHGHSAFRIEAGAVEILIDPFLSDNPSWDKGWSGYLAGENSHREVIDEGDCGDGPGCGNGRDEAGGTARAAGGGARRPLGRELRRCHCSGSCVGIHLG